MSSFEPQAFGKYFLVDKIATGGMAEIFKAKTFGHGGFENLVVIKRILGHLSDNQDFVEMFIDEAKVSVALQHANIVRVYDFGKVLDNYFIAMECVEGKDIRAILRRLSKQRRYLPIDFALFVVHEVCRGLGYAHGKTDLRGHPFGIVHRDVSPSNVLVSYDGDIKIADFGIAKAEQNTYTTADGVLKGKFEYMSPEQARGEPVDPRSDLFSLGILLYEMLTGRRLFKGESDLETLERIKRGDVRPPREVTPRVPPEAEAIVMKLLAPDRADRFQTAAKAQAAIRDVLGRSPDEIRPELRQFVRDLFREDILEEIARFESGSAIAAAWRSTADESLWEGNTSTSGTLQTAPAQAPAPTARRSAGIVAVVVALFLVVGAIAAGLTAWALLGQQRPEIVVVEPIAPAAPTVGRLSINVLPAAEMFLDGRPIGQGSTLRVPDLAPGEYVLKLVVEGREPHEEKVVVTAGEDALVQHTFPLAEASTDRTPRRSTTTSRPAAPVGDKPQIEFVTTPPGATVLVDGRVVGVTPTTFTGEVDVGYAIELKLDGYTTYRARLDPLAAGSTVPVRRELSRPAAAQPGTLAVGIIGGGWGHVYIDGKKQDQTAPGRYTVAAGTHTIRVVNEDLQLEYTEQVTVGAGATVRVNARP